MCLRVGVCQASSSYGYGFLAAYLYLQPLRTGCIFMGLGTRKTQHLHYAAASQAVLLVVVIAAA